MRRMHVTDRDFLHEIIQGERTLVSYTTTLHSVARFGASSSCVSPIHSSSASDSHGRGFAPASRFHGCSLIIRNTWTQPNLSGSAHAHDPTRCHSPPLAKVAQAGDDVRLLVQPLVDPSGDLPRPHSALLTPQSWGIQFLLYTHHFCGRVL